MGMAEDSTVTGAKQDDSNLVLQYCNYIRLADYSDVLSTPEWTRINSSVYTTRRFSVQKSLISFTRLNV
jgi:hypothetical protein